MKRFAKVLVVLLALTGLVDAASAAMIRGRLLFRTPMGVQPAGGVAVTVVSPWGRSTPAWSGPDGMYYVYNLPPGDYQLEIWADPRPGAPPRVYPVRVFEPGTDVPPIWL